MTLQGCSKFLQDFLTDCRAFVCTRVKLSMQLRHQCGTFQRAARKALSMEWYDICCELNGINDNSDISIEVTSTKLKKMAYIGQNITRFLACTC